MKTSIVELAHGSGGKSMHELIEEVFVSSFDNEFLRERNDQASFAVQAGRMVMSTDSFVISPLFFPGGNIGSLAVHGTVNDVAMAGAVPLYLSASYIIEEGLPLDDLRAIARSMAAAAQQAQVAIVTGDTKVVEKGKGDGLFITTTGIGVVPAGVDISVARVKPGDKVLINGNVGDHGVAVMSRRQNLGFETNIVSDSASLNELVAKMVAAVPDIHCLRDPTRGGVAATLNEIAQTAKVDIMLEEPKIPYQEEVLSACELLGLDPLYVANEGKLLAFCEAAQAERLLAAMQEHPLGRKAAIIGEVSEGTHNFVELRTRFGSARLVHWLAGDQLPRIC